LELLVALCSSSVDLLPKGDNALKLREASPEPAPFDGVQQKSETLVANYLKRFGFKAPDAQEQ
jgi:hypothetical protein